MDKHLVKRGGHVHLFDERKVYASCYAACLSAHVPHIEAEKICKNVCRDIKKWVKPKKAVTTEQIFKETGKSIKKYNKDAAFMYSTHRDIS
mgnify:FL=1